MTSSSRGHEATATDTAAKLAKGAAGRCLAEELFTDRPGYTPRAGDLAAARGASPLLRRIESLVKDSIYPYQRPLHGCSGPVATIDGRSMQVFSAYDYLGLIGHPRVSAAARDALRDFGTSSGGVRLLTGTTYLHDALDSELARFKGTEAALSVSSGYMANLAAITGLLGPGDRAVLDQCAHRSIIDGCRLAGARVAHFEHNSPESLRSVLETTPVGRRTLIAVEGIYSMDGDICRLPEIVAVKKEYGAYLMVDEAHSFCVLGATGRGVDEHFGVSADEIDLWVGTLSKAIPSNGGFIAATREVVLLLQHLAAPFIFSAALCPSAIAASLAALAVVKSEPERMRCALRNGERLRMMLNALGFDTGFSSSPVVPVILGADEYTHAFARRLFDLGLYVTPVVYPAVPKGAARLRLCATAGHSAADIEKAVACLRGVRDEMALSGEG